MMAPTVDKPQTDSQPGYLGYLMQAALDFGNDLGVDPGQVSGMLEILLSPVDGLE